VSNTSITLRDLRKAPLTLATDTKHTITVSRFVGQILEMEDLNFHLDSAVMLPDPACDEDPATDPQDRITGLAVLRACYKYAADNPDEQIVIAGHADASGNSAEYNFTLSGLRADNVRCALDGDRAGWVKIANGKHKVEDYQQILLWASHTFGWNCNPGQVDGVAGEKTSAALSGFQKRYNHEFSKAITVDGAVGPQTWGAFFDLYMRELAELMDTDDDGLASARRSLVFVDDGHRIVGCGASHPIEQVTAIAVRPAPGTPVGANAVTTGPTTGAPGASTTAPGAIGSPPPDAPLSGGFRSVQNRRVEILFFEPGHEPQFPCHPDAKTCIPGTCEIYRGAFTLTHIPCGGTLSPRLVSRHALDLLEETATTINEVEFLAWATSVFGSDVPLESYRAWRDDIVSGALQPPHIRLVDPGVLGGELGDYNDDTEEIRVAKDLALKAETSQPDAADLFLVLLHEFGHHVDNLLRRVYSDPPVDGDAPGEEGALFALGIAGLNQDESDHVVFATHIHDGESHDLQLSYPQFQKAVQDYIGDPQKQAQAKQNNVEGFDAGSGRPDGNFFAHESIEIGLSIVDSQFYTPLVRQLIYFGNWERDYSQFCGASTLVALSVLIGPDTPTTNRVLARLAITGYLDRKAKADADFSQIQPTSVTTTNLGVYRPEEHVDNPEGLGDDSQTDSSFRAPVLPLEYAVDPDTGIKNYIAHDRQKYSTSTAYISRSLTAALAAGLTPEGMRLFGQALHTLEDLFAHSNFVELTLIRLGNTSVFPWVGLHSQLTVHGDRRFPMVTGVFGGVDAMISLISAIGDSLKPPIDCTGKVFSQSSVEALTLLLNSLISPTAVVLIPRIEAIQVNQDQVGQDLTKFSKALCDAGEAGKTWVKRKLGAVLKATLSELALLENGFVTAIPTSARTNPTHSMLSKDHPTHPLHVIAAQCATAAVGTAGLAMRDAFLGKSPVSAAIATITGFFIHPNDIPWSQATHATTSCS
jgi:hypothetical protein